jgi:hypothetical protein
MKHGMNPLLGVVAPLFAIVALSGSCSDVGVSRPHRSALAAGQQYLSKYNRLTDPGILVGNAVRTAVSTTVTLKQQSSVFVCSDGRVFPGPGSASKPRASLRLYIDGQPYGNETAIDWGMVAWSNTGQHCFNAIATEVLNAGNHVFEMRAAASTPNASKYTVSEASISVLVDGADYLQSGDYGSSPNCCQTYNYDVTSMISQFGCKLLGRQDTYGLLPFQAMIDIPFAIKKEETVYFMASGISDHSLCAGDAMWCIAIDNTLPASPNNAFSTYHRAQYTVNDLFVGAELEAPMYCQGRMIPGETAWPGGSGTVSLVSSEFPYCFSSGSPCQTNQNPIQYTVNPTTTLVVLKGEMVVHGSANTLLQTDPIQGNEYVCINGTSSPTTFCFPMGTEVDVAQGILEVPQDHSGVVFFSAKVRCQAGSTNDKGSVFIWLEIDGVRVGGTGVQQLALGSDSQRTLTISYLAAENNALTAGSHIVKLRSKCSGQFKHLLLHNDGSMLVWFD